MMLSSSLSFSRGERKKRERERKEEKGRHEIVSDWGKKIHFSCSFFGNAQRPNSFVNFHRWVSILLLG